MKKALVLFVLIITFIASCTLQSTPYYKGTQIHDIQGCSHISPMKGRRVDEVRGVVTHKFTNGFTMQSDSPDDKACSSEAVFVFTAAYPKVAVADLVTVSGLVEEFQPGNPEDLNLTLTEIAEPLVKIIGHDFSIPQAVVLDYSAVPDKIIENDGFSEFDIEEDGLDFYESLESMLVGIDRALVVAPRNQYNEIFIIPQSVLTNNIVSGLGPIIETEYDQNPEMIMVKLPASQNDQINAGAVADDKIIGILDYSFGLYKIFSFTEVNFSPSGIEIGRYFHNMNGLSLASYNVNNISRFDEGNRIRKVAHVIVDDLDSPHILVLHEIMDDSGSVDDGKVSATKTLDLLVAEIRREGGPVYEYSDSPPDDGEDGGLEGGNIRSVLLFRTDQNIRLEAISSGINEIIYQGGEFLVPSNPFRIGTSTDAFSGSRKPSVWLLSVDDKQLFVIGAHLISQGENNPNWGNIQPPVHPKDQKRYDQAAYLQMFTNKLLLLNDATPVIVAGDLNTDPWSDVMDQLKGNTLFDTTEFISDTDRFTYIFEGNAQQLDYILINRNLSALVKDSQVIHINSTCDKDNQISDHDPVIAVIDLDAINSQ